MECISLVTGGAGMTVYVRRFSNTWFWLGAQPVVAHQTIQVPRLI